MLNGAPPRDGGRPPPPARPADKEIALTPALALALPLNGDVSPRVGSPTLGATTGTGVASKRKHERTGLMFKCGKCRRASFDTLASLKEHRKTCMAEAAATAPTPGQVQAQAPPPPPPQIQAQAQTQAHIRQTQATTAPHTGLGLGPGRPAKPARKVFLCSACGTYYDQWNMFTHMKEVHDRHVCLYCLGMFSKGRKLAAHLQARHGLCPGPLPGPPRLPPSSLLCLECDGLFSSEEDFPSHRCASAATASDAKMIPRLPDAVSAFAGLPTSIPRLPDPDFGSLLSAIEAESVQRLADDEDRIPTAVPVPAPAVVVAPAPAEPPHPPPPAAPEERFPADPASLFPTDRASSSSPAPLMDPREARLAELVRSNYERMTERKFPKFTVKIPREASAADPDVDVEAEGAEKTVGEDEEPAPAGEDVPLTELTLDRPVDRYPPAELLRALLATTAYACIYCNHARKIPVDGRGLARHLVSEHRFRATVDSITAEELLPETIVAKIRANSEAVRGTYVNLDGYDEGEKEVAELYERTYECFQCYFITTAHKDLYAHNRKNHQNAILLCVMCKSTFFNYSELICHRCPGVYFPDAAEKIDFRCSVCKTEPIPSSFRLMVHLRKAHDTCEVCLERCGNQSRLSTHVWKHKLNHFCFRCSLAYRNKPDITNHLFWKHGTESKDCERCLQKKWPHVYHFCVPPLAFACDECGSQFGKAVHLKVHRRTHTGHLPHRCSRCEEAFVSKNLLEKHAKKHDEPIEIVDITKDEPTADAPTAIDSADNPESSEKTPGTKKSKKKKKDPSLFDVDLPALNLSESGSSDESEAENATEKVGESVEVAKPADLPSETSDEPVVPSVDLTESPEDESKIEPVVGVWDNFKAFQAQEEKRKEAPVRRHVCDSDHNYCAIVTDEVVDAPEPKEKEKEPPKDKIKRSKTKKRTDRRDGSSSSDSSSDSDSCSCGSNCSCSSSSGSSSSSSSSSDSDSTAGGGRKRRKRKESDGSAIDIMTPEEPQPLATDAPDVHESDLFTEEEATDEEFYDVHPQKIGKVPDERSEQLNGAGDDVDEENKLVIDLTRKKVKTKKAKKEKRDDAGNLMDPKDRSRQKANKITISLHSKTVNMSDKSMEVSSPHSGSNSDAGRASKRKRVRNKFYGYSSDEDQQPPKLEWRKEDLPSPVNAKNFTGAKQHKYESVNTNVYQSANARNVKNKTMYSDDSDASSDEFRNIKKRSKNQDRAKTNSKPGIKMSVSRVSDNVYTTDSERKNFTFLDIPDDVLKARQEASKTSGSFVSPGDIVPFPKPAGAREAKEGESVYCYCQCPYDEVSEMIACDGDGCKIEWFHFECVGIAVPPKGMWFCPDCRNKLEYRRLV